MREITEIEARYHISASRFLSAEEAGIRLWAVAQIFYRQPLGEDALAELNNRLGKSTTGVLAYVVGFIRGSESHSGGPDWSSLLPDIRLGSQK